MLHERESVFIPQTTKHQLKNPGRIPLEIIEIQNGSYIGEDDIVRYERARTRSYMYKRPLCGHCAPVLRGFPANRAAPAACVLGALSKAP